MYCNYVQTVQWCTLFERILKGQIISKANCQVVNSSKKQTNELVFTTTYATCFRSFLEESEDTKKTFRNYLTFKQCQKRW